MVSSHGGPRIDAEGFGIEYDSDPMLKTLVKSFDETGLVLNTQSLSAVDSKPETSKSSSMSSAAKQATKRALKK